MNYDPKTQRSDCKTTTVYRANEDHENLQPVMKDQLLQGLSPFENLFDEKLVLCAGKLSHFRVKNDHDLRCQTPYNTPTKFLPLVEQEEDRLAF